MSMEKEFTPQFETEEQEAEYWDTHSPLDFVAEPKPQSVRVRGAKDRPITIRLDKESRSKLEKLAAEQRLGPSTFARLILMSAIERSEKLPKRVTLDELKDVLEKSLPQSAKDQAESIAKAISVGNLEDPDLIIVYRPQIEELQDLWLKFTNALLAAGTQVITPEDSKYEKLRSTSNRSP